MKWDQYDPDQVEHARAAAGEIVSDPEVMEGLGLDRALWQSVCRPFAEKITSALLEGSDLMMRDALIWAHGQKPTTANLTDGRLSGRSFTLGNKRHWSAPWIAGLSGSEPTPLSADLTDEVLDDVLPGIQKAVLNSLDSFASTAQQTELITRALIRWSVQQGNTSIRELGMPAIAMSGQNGGGTAYGRIDLVVFRKPANGQRQPDLAIEIDSSNSARSIPKLEMARDIGAVPVWVRWKAGGLRELPGVHVVDCRPVKASRHVAKSQINAWRPGSIAS